jgi:hypothetical protein
MNRILSPTFWIQTFVGVLFTMVIIYIIKKAVAKYPVPVLSEVAASV